MSGTPERDCVFCRIVRRELPATIVFENERLLAFDDIRPRAPVHVLVIPKRHIASLNEVPDDAGDLIGEILLKARDIAHAKGVGRTGYRVVLNTARDSGQEVYHIHFHVLGGRPLRWPPG